MVLPMKSNAAKYNTICTYKVNIPLANRITSWLLIDTSHIIIAVDWTQ